MLKWYDLKGELCKFTIHLWNYSSSEITLYESMCNTRGIAFFLKKKKGRSIGIMIVININYDFYESKPLIILINHSSAAFKCFLAINNALKPAETKIVYRFFFAYVCAWLAPLYSAMSSRKRIIHFVTCQ